MAGIAEQVEELLAGGIAEATRKMVLLHLRKPWAGPGFLAVAIRPLKGGLEAFLGPEVFRDEMGRPWSFPSNRWWLAHARTSHGPGDGAGCDADAHVAFLTEGGRDAEFAYANVFDGTPQTLRVLGRGDFEEECSWWARNFKID